MLQKLINFSHYSSIKIGIPKIVNIIQTPKDYYSLLQNSTPQIIGKANNLLISPEAKNLILLDDDFDYIKDYENYLEVGGLTPSRKLFTYAKKNNLKGFEILGGIPGSIGGIIKMNAGLKNHEIKSTLLGILSIQDSHVLEFTPTQALKLEYRSSAIDTLIFAGIFKKKKGFDTDLLKHFKNMRNNQPKEPSFGSCFKNPPNHYAGTLIQNVQLKGVRFGKNKNLCFSPKHANFMINLGDSSFDEAVELLELAKKRVYENYGITLQEEVCIIR